MTASRRTLWWARIVCLSAFGPYVTGSARTEQIAVFGSVMFILVTGWLRMIRAPLGPAPFLVAWSGLVAVMLISTVFRPFDPGFYGSQPASHALSDMALPLALIVITWYWTLTADPVSLIRAVVPVAVAGMCVNAVIEIVQVSATKAAVVSFLPRFWDANPSAGSVAANAASDGRYTGVFDQPAEAGIAYGVALLAMIWLARQRAWKPLAVTCAAVLLVTGGVLTVSKVFLLCALPVAVLTVLRGTARIRVLVTGAMAGGALWLAGITGMLPVWRGVAHLVYLARPGTSLTAQYTAGRYGSGGTLAPVIADVLRAAPLAGFGAGGMGTAYDSLWQEVLVVSGVLGVIFAATVFVMLAWRLTGLRTVLAREHWQLACGVAVVAAGASVGIPSLTANRAATLLWLVLGVLVTARSPGRRLAGPDGHHPRAGIRDTPSGTRAQSVRPDQPVTSASITGVTLM
jgi:hypothetical protein